MRYSVFFDFLRDVKLKPFKRAPALIAFTVISLVCLVRLSDFDFLEKVERMTYDMRARQALKFSPPVAANLGFVFINEDSVKAVWDRSLGFSFGLLWPRQVYGRLVNELAAQGAKAVAFDIVFGELRPDHPSVQMADGRTLESDDFFALQLRHASNVIIAISKDLTPPPMFLTNALAVGDVSTERDSDGILRRVQICYLAPQWHAAFRQAQADYDIDLAHARFAPGVILLTNRSGEKINVPLDKDGNFDLADFVGDQIPPGMAPKAKPFTSERVWHMGVVLAARQLNLDLSKAEVDLSRGKIILRGPGIERVIPVDRDGYAYVDWSLSPNAPQLTQEAFHEVLAQNKLRLDGHTEELTNRWKDKLVVVGSSAIIGNNLTDRGATPLSRDTLLASKHWNVANSLLTGRFVHRSSLVVDLALITLLGILAAFFTWGFGVLGGAASVIALMATYIALSIAFYNQSRLWIPLVLPLGGALAITYVCLLAWLLIFEQAQRRRLRAIFSTMVSPKIAKVLEESESLPSLGGARREITVLFADVRGFTQLTDTSQERVAEFVEKNKLTGAQAEACFDQQAQETLDIVNLYLGLVHDILMNNHDGTLDKFIGDCVMAFWGAPTPQPTHATMCVRAAIAAQRAIADLNQQHVLENKRREIENLARISAGLPVKPILPLLLLGSGINTGMANVGMMGSKFKQKNYTVFGREVNLASRLESASGRSRIFIGETTYQHLLRDDPALAATCTQLDLRELKGFRSAIRAYEVPWRAPGEKGPEEEEALANAETSFTGLLQRQH